jgi:hypothetical protein
MRRISSEDRNENDTPVTVEGMERETFMTGVEPGLKGKENIKTEGRNLVKMTE